VENDWHMLMQELSAAFTQRQEVNLRSELGELCRSSMQAGDGSQDARMAQQLAKKKVFVQALATLVFTNDVYPLRG
jgi:hypothetical protein